MKIAFVIPKNGREGEKSFYDYKFISSFLMSKKYFSYLLAIPVLASLTSPEHEIKVFDENIEEIDYEWEADLVAISVRTMFAPRAYEISDKFRKKGIKTILGGIHPSMCTEESLKHCDSVLVGEAENVWKIVLNDIKAGALKKIYKFDKRADLTTIPRPQLNVLSRDEYFSDIIQTTKGCPFQCDFCSVYAFDGQKIRNKKIEQVAKEIESICRAKIGFKKKSIFFADDNIIANKKFARELFIELKKYNINWSCQASINISKEDELLNLMKKSGCGAILIGLESISEKNLHSMDKGINLKYDYIDSIKRIQEKEILVHSSFIIGFDHDTPNSFDSLIDFIKESRLLMPLINILTPFPGTLLHKRLEKEGRILHKDWSKYNGRNVVFKPANMTPEQLNEGFKKIVRAIYSFDNIYKQLEYYWRTDFWKHSNAIDPVSIKYRFLFALRLCSLISPMNIERNKFILKILPKLFNSRVRISTILTLMAYNDSAYS